MPESTVARQLEESLSAVFLASADLAGWPVRMAHAGGTRPVPGIVIEARELGEDLGVLLDDGYATELELRFVVMAHGLDKDTEIAVERMARKARVIFQESAPGGFEVLNINEYMGEERENEGNLRIITPVYRVTAHPLSA